VGLPVEKILVEKINLLEVLNSKSCSTCTKCCEGYLSANIKGHIMDLGKPCPFVMKDVGCGDYENRPINPCVKFQCEWRRNPYFDDWLSPKNSGVVFTRSELKGLEYLKITEAGNSISQEIIDWAIKYAQKNQLNLSWNVETKFYWVGSSEFIGEMKLLYPN
jgi:hypothetical protein